MFDSTEIFCLQEESQSVSEESNDYDDDEGLGEAAKLSLKSCPESPECPSLFLSLIHIKDGSALQSLNDHRSYNCVRIFESVSIRTQKLINECTNVHKTIHKLYTMYICLPALS